MERVVDEAEYVLAVLHRTRDEVTAYPTLFDPDAPERIDEAIDRLQQMLQMARSQLMTSGMEQNAKAA